MNIKELYKMQKKLDETIIKNECKKIGIDIKDYDKEKLLKNTILALQVEVAELANATRCFKHWSNKGPESKERILDEYADCLHFFLSIGNQINTNITDKDYQSSMAYFKNKRMKNKSKINLVDLFIAVYITITNFYCSLGYGGEDFNYLVKYLVIGNSLINIGCNLGFTEEEIYQAYLKKHKVNYQRQESGY